MTDTYICAGCGEAFDYGDHDAAEAEAIQNNFDPDQCVAVCEDCFNALRDLNDGAIVVGPTIN